jgi:hypothetical protein
MRSRDELVTDHFDWSRVGEAMDVQESGRRGKVALCRQDEAEAS